MIYDLSGERQRAALTTLSTMGAAASGLAVGVLLAAPLQRMALSILAAGIAIHLFGMVGARRVIASTGYRPAIWERVAYWLCWAVIAVILLNLLWACCREDR